jgi:hypothetical protein
MGVNGGLKMIDRVDKYATITSAIKKHTGIEVKCHIFLSIDESGEIYWGADYGNDKIDQKAMLAKMNYFREQLKKELKKVQNESS